MKQPELCKYLPRVGRGGLDMISEGLSVEQPTEQQAGNPGGANDDVQRISLDIELLQSNPGNSKLEKAFKVFN
jgi:hypothetical protein